MLSAPSGGASQCIGDGVGLDLVRGRAGISSGSAANLDMAMSRSVKEANQRFDLPPRHNYLN